MPRLGDGTRRVVELYFLLDIGSTNIHQLAVMAADYSLFIFSV